MACGSQATVSVCSGSDKALDCRKALVLPGGKKKDAPRSPRAGKAIESKHYLSLLLAGLPPGCFIYLYFFARRAMSYPKLQSPMTFPSILGPLVWRGGGEAQRYAARRFLFLGFYRKLPPTASDFYAKFVSFPTTTTTTRECEDVYASVQWLIRNMGGQKCSFLNYFSLVWKSWQSCNSRKRLSLGKIAYRKLRAKKSIHHHKIINANKSQ